MKYKPVRTHEFSVKCEYLDNKTRQIVPTLPQPELYFVLKDMCTSRFVFVTIPKAKLMMEHEGERLTLAASVVIIFCLSLSKMQRTLSGIRTKRTVMTGCHTEICLHATCRKTTQ